MESIFGDYSRYQHFKAGIMISVVFTILCCLGAMSAAEYKDGAHGGKWDWCDWTWGMIGGVIGQTIQILIIYAIWKLV